jgi:hypothetical protein
MFVGRRPGEVNAGGGCQRRLQQQGRVLYVLESAPFTLATEGLLQFDMFRSSADNSAITLQVRKSLQIF